jgi:hypothetical protein
VGRTKRFCPSDIREWTGVILFSSKVYAFISSKDKDKDKNKDKDNHCTPQKL